MADGDAYARSGRAWADDAEGGVRNRSSEDVMVEALVSIAQSLAAIATVLTDVHHSTVHDGGALQVKAAQS